MSSSKINMVDLKPQYERLKPRIDSAIQEVIDGASFIKGPALREFEANLADYLGVKHVIGVANGTDALQIALMALNLKPGDEVIVPAFTYVATAEVIGLLGLIPVMVDVDINTFNIDSDLLESVLSSKTKAIVPVHLFGQSANMKAILDFARKHNLKVIEDNAQAIGGNFIHNDGRESKTGTLGDIGCTSFFPSKNLGCFGDGGAIFCNDDTLAEKIRMISNHGQKKKYIHTVLGVNSRLDTLQAAILNVKLQELDDFAGRRQKVAEVYNEAFKPISGIKIPVVSAFTNHVYHQYTLKVGNDKRDNLKAYLQEANIPSMIYYPIPLYNQEAFSSYHSRGELSVTERLCKEVLSLPMHTEMASGQQSLIIERVKSFFS
ncbi:MAG: transcriptional regulator [Bacteroidetes bacterium]|nr:MAG: transcriptional regulator [Bacteroidota bacterium]